MLDEPITVADTGVTVRVERHGEDTDIVIGAGRPGALEATDDATVDAVVAAIIAITDPAAARLVSDHDPVRPHALPDLVAHRLGLHERRDLLQLRRGLPVPSDDPGRPPTDLQAPVLRRFDPDRDADAWIRQNNRAFADHPDQGAQRPDTLAATLAEPWVDLGGFLVVDDPDRPGELAGSCWTRRHPAAGDDPELGEIFVIGVDPSSHRRGLGAHLVLGGLDHLAAEGVPTAMLYVESTNAAARRLYERLGFAPHLLRRIAFASTAP